MEVLRLFPMLAHLQGQHQKCLLAWRALEGAVDKVKDSHLDLVNRLTAFLQSCSPELRAELFI